MNGTRKKTLQVFALTITGLFLANSFLFDGREEKEILTTPNIPEEKSIVGEPEIIKDAVSQDGVSLNFPEDFSSPFALLNDFTNEAKSGTIHPEIQAIPQMPEHMPVFPANFELPAMPNMPGMPDIPIVASTQATEVFLKAVLYKPGRSNNMAILDDGAVETIVIEGKNSPWGYVSKITANTVTLANRTLTLEV